jgi:hypothetical protein
MAKRIGNKLNSLEQELPEGLVVDAAWLTRQGYSTSLRSQYVSAGWLEQPARRVYRRPRGALSWQQVVVSLQTLLNYPLVVGGRAALDLQGYAHYLSQSLQEVHLYGPKPPPKWVHTLRLQARFYYHNSARLFGGEVATGHNSLASDPKTYIDGGFTAQPIGQWDWRLIVSTPERALLELLDELPNRESFEQVDKLMEGMTGVSPHRMQRMLANCRSVKVKRLFFFFADRHQHRWLKHLDRKAIDLGSGKRRLVRGGKLDSRYQITVPQAMHGV